MLKNLIIAVTFLLMSTFASAQMSKFQALFIFQFAKNTGWAQDGSAHNFVITVIGDKSVAQDLRQIVNNKAIGDRPIVVEEAVSVSGLPKSDIIFLGESKAAHVKSLVSNQDNLNVLLISGTPGHCSNGMGISFVNEGGKLKYQYSEANIKKHGLAVSSKLTALGSPVF